MPIEVIDIIKQKNAAIFPLLEDTDLLGGMRVAADHTARDAIPSTYRKLGMLVWTQSDNKLWWLSALPNTWTEFTGGSGTGASVVDNLSAAILTTAGQPMSLGATGLVAARADTPAVKEVYGLALTGGPIGNIDIVTSGVCSHAVGGFTPGQVLYLAPTGGVTSTPTTTLGHRLTQIGQARTVNTIQVRIEVIADL